MTPDSLLKGFSAGDNSRMSDVLLRHAALVLSSVAQRGKLLRLGSALAARGHGVGSVVAAAWPITQTSFLQAVWQPQPQQQRQHGNAAANISAVAAFYAAWLNLADALAAHPLPERALQQPLLHLLAFNDAFVRALWQHTSSACQMPREVPEQATRGLDMPALAGGVAALNEQQVWFTFFHSAHWMWQRCQGKRLAPKGVT